MDHVPPERKAKAMAALHKYENLGKGKEFPTLRITATGIGAEGEFAKRQAEFLVPDAPRAASLARHLEEARVGVVAHFYMDAELQGLLFAARSAGWPHIFVSDSLAMADAALEMARAGVHAVLCLGVDFMSENCRAVLDASGFGDVPVYRLSEEPIGCSLSAAAENEQYSAWLREAAESSTDPKVHVIYINTSLATKAMCQSTMPTVTCTSSNVVRTILQLTSQVPRVRVYYGPDSYMGHNIVALFKRMAASLTDEQIRSVHPSHDRRSVGDIAEQLRFYDKGYCLVHHLFGSDVARRIREVYVRGQPDDAFACAHLEVPGDAFDVALAAQEKGMGVVGSTSDILNFIGKTVDRISSGTGGSNGGHKMRFLLGTEAGLCTSIVRKVQDVLKKNHSGEEVELIFPVSSQAVDATGDVEVPLVPGVCGGEGCSLAGGCASCPFMKMNSFAALEKVLANIGSSDEADRLKAFRPRTPTDPAVTVRGTVPILAMRHFQTTGRFSDELIRDIVERASP